MALRTLVAHRSGAMLMAVALALGALLTVIILLTQKPTSVSASDVLAITTGGYYTSGHSCAVTTSGAVECWGVNTVGQLGDGTTSQHNTPAPVTGLGSGVAAVAAGMEHTCALTTGGAVSCWGKNHLGQLGDGSTTNQLTPVAVSGLGSGVVAIAAGGNHTCAITGAGALKCWGRNAGGQLGIGINDFDPHAVPEDVVGLGSGVVAVALGSDHSCAVTTAGAVKCWGFNAYGQLGDGSNASHSAPITVSGLASGGAAVAAGYQHTCAVTTAGGAKCWGENGNGQLGDGTNTGPQVCSSSVPCSNTPVDVGTLTSGVAKIEAGDSHTCAVTTAGGLKCWGLNYEGQLGDSSFQDRLTPRDVTGLTSGAAVVSAAAMHTCALTTSAALKCWGSNQTGQVGNPACLGNCAGPITVLELKPTPTNTPTATPCPPEGCPTATPTSTPTPCPTPDCGLDFSIGIESTGGNANDCNSSGAPTATCLVEAGTQFKLSFYLNSLPTALTNGEYEAYDLSLQPVGVTSDGSVQSVHPFFWPACVKWVNASFPGQVNVGCVIGIGQDPSSYSGLMAQIDFTCSDDGSITMTHGPGNTGLFDDVITTYYESPTTESITINCVSPLAYAGDTDGDGCPDASEQGANPMWGGQRNYLSHWDYFNPTKDHQNRIDDILAVRDQYFIDVSDPPSYSTQYDRTYLGPNPWNLGPPNGQIRIDDVLAARDQYFHDCS